MQDGLWKLHAGNPSGARASVEAALKINPADIRALAVMRQSYAAQKQWGSPWKESRSMRLKSLNRLRVQDSLEWS